MPVSRCSTNWRNTLPLVTGIHPRHCQDRSVTLPTKFKNCQREGNAAFRFIDENMSDPAKSTSIFFHPQCACIWLLKKRILAIPIAERGLPLPPLYSSKYYSTTNCITISMISTLHFCGQLTSYSVATDRVGFMFCSFPSTRPCCFLLCFFLDTQDHAQPHVR